MLYTARVCKSVDFSMDMAMMRAQTTLQGVIPMFGLGTTELIIILVLVMIIFGAGKLPQVGGALGKGLRNFKDGIKEGNEEKSEEEPEKIDDKEQDK
jgi:sec-independent protein translocase protein TatA